MKKRKAATSTCKFKMVKFNLNMRRQNRNFKVLLFNLVVLGSYLMVCIDSVNARKQEGDDIIMTKGKLIMRGGKGKGHLILDTGKSGDHEVSHMMPMMGHHFNPYSFYPMQHHQSQAPMIHVHPVYIEDHSAMHHHPEPSHHHEYKHHEEKHYPEHHGMEYQHHEPHYQEMHHHQMHQEMHHQPEHHEEEQQQHHEPMGHHYEQEAHHEEGGGGHHGASMGYESNPMMQMMMHGSGPQPAYDQLAALQALQHQALYAGPHFQDPASQQYQQHLLQNLHEQKEQQVQLQEDSKPVQVQQQQQQQQQQQETQQQSQSQPQQQSNKVTSFFDQAGNNPLVAIIKPIFKRDPNKQKKP